MTQVDRFALIQSVFNREPTEKVPFSMWKHFVEADKTPEGLAEAQLNFQRQFGSDLMKISPHGSYCVVDFGGVLGDYNPVSGSRICVRKPILSLDDWETLEPIDPNAGEFGAQVKAVQLIHNQLENEIPTMMTIFSPFMVASKLDPALLEHLVQDRTLLKEQIQMLTKLMSEFCGAVLDAGSDGLFLATQHFNSLLSPSSLNDFEFQPLKTLLDQYQHKSAFNVLHLHGNSPFFHKATEMPHVSAINWHDQRTEPSLLEARQHFDRGLLGGLDEMGIIRTGSRGDIERAIYSIHRQFNDWGLMFSPGCVLPLDVPDEHLTWVAETINSLQPIG